MNINNNIRRLRAIWKPSMFQGWGKKSQYFEGWYYKMISADQNQAIAIIPGISYSDQGNHAFIQVMDGIKKTSRYERFAPEQFSPSPDQFALSVGNNHFSLEMLDLDLPYLSGRVEMIDPVPYTGSIWSPGIMGWYSLVPFMQCYHGLVSVHHRLSGTLNFHGQSFNFSHGKGYIEKDWGSSFPLAWVWTQCNHYEQYEDLSIMASVAHIPWMGKYFIGFLAIVYFEQKIKIFTTYTKAKMELDLQADQVYLTFRDHESELHINAQQQEGTDLISPQQGAMTGKVNESLQARHEITYVHQGKRFETAGKMAGLEVGGNSRILLDQNSIR